MCFLLFVGVLCLSLFCYALLFVHSSFASVVAPLLFSYRCFVTVNVLPCGAVGLSAVRDCGIF